MINACILLSFQQSAGNWKTITFNGHFRIHESCHGTSCVSWHLHTNECSIHPSHPVCVVSTLHSRWACSRWCRARPGQPRTRWATRPETTARLWPPHAVACCLSPVGVKADATFMNMVSFPACRQINIWLCGYTIPPKNCSTSTTLHALLRAFKIKCGGEQSFPFHMKRPELESLLSWPQLQNVCSSPIPERSVWVWMRMKGIFTGWKKLAWAPSDSNRRQVSRLPVRTLECSCWEKKKKKDWFIYLSVLLQMSQNNTRSTGIKDGDTLQLLVSVTLLKSLAVQLSSSLQGIRWTKANIWYLALMNSALFGLRGEQSTTTMITWTNGVQ